jgi:protein-S-isoprenylcysteine O-methyltransferase Ste14
MENSSCFLSLEPYNIRGNTEFLKPTPCKRIPVSPHIVRAYQTLNGKNPMTSPLRIPPLHFLVALAVGLGLHFGLNRPFLLPLPWPRPVALVLMAVAAAMALWAAGCLISAKTTWHPDHKPSVLVTTGPFRFSRNPAYLSLLSVLFGAAWWSCGLLTFLAPVLYFLSMNYFYIPFEEQMMESSFGENFRTYRQSVRRWL